MNQAGSNPGAFIDANIPMYASGSEHPLRAPCALVMDMIAAHPDRFITDAEVFQEIIHRYLSERRWLLGREVFNRFARAIQRRIEPVYTQDVFDAAALADDHPGINARDLVHAAVALRLGVSRIISTDADFDRLPVITRLAPERIDEWGDALMA